MRRYAAYGLALESELPLDGLAEAPPDAPTVTIRRGSVGHDPVPAPSPRYVGDPLDGCVFWDAVGAVRVRRGSELVVDADGSELASAFVLGASLGVLLAQRGLAALHASVVSIDGRAVGFVGQSGTGKSTLASALHERGHPVVADDILAADLAGDDVLVHPGPALLKLDRGGAEAAVPVGGSAGPIPLGRVYVLEDGLPAAVEAMRPADAVIELVRHSWVPRSLHARDPDARLGRAGSLVSRVPVRRLRRPRPEVDAADVARLIEEDTP